MHRDKKLKSEELCMGNDKTQKRKVQITSILTLFVFLVDIYLIIYVPTDYILATAAFVTFVLAIFTINGWFKLKEIENQRRDEQYADIMKAEKGSYVVTLDTLKEIDGKINFIGQKIMPLGKAGDENQRKIASMLDNIVQDQKKIAKITISRSKENADALMNSNDQLLVQMTAFRDTMEAIKDQINKQLQMGGQGNEDFGGIKDELFQKMQELTESIKKEVDEISENIEISNQSVENLVSLNKTSAHPEESVIANPNMMQQEPALEEELPDNIITEQLQNGQVMSEAVQGQPSDPETAQEVTSVQEEPVIPETIEIEGNDIVSELLMEKKPLDEAMLAEELPAEEPVAAPEMADANNPMSPEDIAALLSNVPEESVPEPVTATVKEEKPSAPDPNKPMSPEDIAALIANSATENLPEETAKFEEEDKPPMPDLSDPGKTMSPDDIAALIANM